MNRPALLLVAIFALLPAIGAEEKPLHWYEDWNTAHAASVKECKPILIELGASWCPPCKKMEGGVLSGTRFRKLSDKVVLLRSDIDLPDGKSLQRRFLAPYIPTYVFLEPDGREIGRLFGPQPEASFLVRLSSWIDKTKEVACPSSPLKT